MKNETPQPSLVDGVSTGKHAEMSYSDYLKLDDILDSQSPLSNAHDEMLFIIQHQTSELWMRLAIYEMDAARSAIARSDLQPAMKMLRRVTSIFAQLNGAWDVLRTMTPSEYIAQYVYQEGAKHGKRVQAMGGAKNHDIILPGANMEQAVNDVIGAAFGSAGERCMALPVVVPVGKKTADEFVDRVIGEAEQLKVGISTDLESQFGPLISGAHKSKVESYIQLAIDEGSTAKLDGREFFLQGYENGFFLGPTVLDDVTVEMTTYREEIFGPVLQIVRANTFEEAIAAPTQHQYGNGVAIFTNNGGAAREFAKNVNVGMVGINVPIPVPVSYHTFGGWKRSAFGDTNQYGAEGVRFWTKIKTVTQ